jgi:hypothetical protein
VDPLNLKLHILAFDLKLTFKIHLGSSRPIAASKDESDAESLQMTIAAESITVRSRENALVRSCALLTWPNSIARNIASLRSGSTPHEHCSYVLSHLELG